MNSNRETPEEMKEKHNQEMARMDTSRTLEFLGVGILFIIIFVLLFK